MSELKNKISIILTLIIKLENYLNAVFYGPKADNSLGAKLSEKAAEFYGEFFGKKFERTL